MKRVEIITDGSCLQNPGGPGGWACILRFSGKKKEIWGSDPETTNNRMEMMAVIGGLAALKQPCQIKITTDSELVKRCAQGQWKRKSNIDLWVEYDLAADGHTIEWEWTRGHADHEDNNRCDELARRAAQDQSSGERWVPDGN